MPPTNITERESLLPKPHKPFYRPRPLWILPFAIIAALVRGITIAPRVQVYNQLACSAVRSNYNHTMTSLSYPIVVNHTDTTLSVPVIFKHQEPFDCLADPEVQASSARIQAIVATSAGLLSMLSTRWWGAFGERHGRTKVLAAATLGLLIIDIAFLCLSGASAHSSTHQRRSLHPTVPVTKYLPLPPLLILAPILEGALGGWSSLYATLFAYLADCSTSPASRTPLFSRFTGVVYVGFSLGPAIGAAIIRAYSVPGRAVSHTDTAVAGDTSLGIHRVFAAAVIGSTVNVILALFVFPESRGKSLAAQRVSSSSIAVNTNVLMTQRVQNRRGLPLLALAMFAYMLSTGLFQLKYLYAGHIYGWGPEQLSYFISLLGGTRACLMLVVIPLIMKLIKSKPRPKPQPRPKLSPQVASRLSSTRKSTTSGIAARNLYQAQNYNNARYIVPPIPPYGSRSLSTTTNATTGSVSISVSRRAPSSAVATNATESPTAHLAADLLLTRFTLGLEAVSHILVLLAPAHAAGPFVFASALSAIGAGTHPAIQSVVVGFVGTGSGTASGSGTNEEVEGRETSGDLEGGVKSSEDGFGHALGVMAMMQAAGQMVFGPSLFGFVYSETVRQYPKAIFALAASLLICAFVLVSFVRAPSTPALARTVTVNTGNQASVIKKVKPKGRVAEVAIPGAGMYYGGAGIYAGVYSSVGSSSVSTSGSGNRALKGKGKRRRDYGEEERERGRSVVRKDLGYGRAARIDEVGLTRAGVQASTDITGSGSANTSRSVTVLSGLATSGMA